MSNNETDEYLIDGVTYRILAPQAQVGQPDSKNPIYEVYNSSTGSKVGELAQGNGWWEPISRQWYQTITEAIRALAQSQDIDNEWD